ncbi:hypothetical protein C7441_105230 [Pseudaminobacter salicylatoxidans]|uniref:Secreted protein n=1 Tax=Pseudaminobacter salicylatoxidans TaxID=93369 RepID=A0A316C5N0_PSESE|nr:hypothetical protein C7441_105230 [Pseudaminobacter salicylatoxidans]
MPAKTSVACLLCAGCMSFSRARASIFCDVIVAVLGAAPKVSEGRIGKPVKKPALPPQRWWSRFTAVVTIRQDRLQSPQTSLERLRTD